MKKLIFIILILPLFAVAQTVPNGNFESWFWVGSSENPESWLTDNTELGPTVTQDYESYEGDIAMRVTAQPTGLGEYGSASTLIEATAIPPALKFYAKSEVEFGATSIEIAILNNETVVQTQYWFSSESIPEYTLISIPLDQTEPDMTHIQITVMAEVGDLVPGSAWISVDAMEFGEPTGLEKIEKLELSIFPNPSSDYITIQSPQGLIGQIYIVDAQGKTVYEEHITKDKGKIDVQRLSKGTYTIFGNGDKPIVGKFVVN